MQDALITGKKHKESANNESQWKAHSLINKKYREDSKPYMPAGGLNAIFGACTGWDSCVKH